MTDKKIMIRRPLATDGHRLYDLVAQCPPLDGNSMYCNLLQCTHFGDTSAAAEQHNQLVGFVSGYLVPQRPNTLFIWQVAVGEPARGQGIATRMINHIIRRDECREVKWIETTITRTNEASWALFNRLAEKLQTKLKQQLLFDEQTHFNGQHNSEIMARIGPFDRGQLTTTTK